LLEHSTEKKRGLPKLSEVRGKKNLVRSKGGKGGVKNLGKRKMVSPKWSGKKGALAKKGVQKRGGGTGTEGKSQTEGWTN